MSDHDNLVLNLAGLGPNDVAAVLEFVEQRRAGATSSVEYEIDYDVEVLPSLTTIARDAFGVNFETVRASTLAALQEDDTLGWTVAAVEALREDLWGRADVQLQAFDHAIIFGQGRITRAELYDLGQYNATRKLNNWTAPFKGARDWIVSKAPEYGVPEDHTLDTWLPMEPDYGPGTGFRKAIAFDVLDEIVRLVWTKA
ncbi:hypothetical protein [Nocardioides alkalitolerans]|uniref:hypothetical protein n=1 Tax=Nocardioides alkalitolerans TaxID=281714 RepID=UPI0004015DF3|nr:hypothetical protein [Nocardioides alkalitolerans]